MGFNGRKGFAVVSNAFIGNQVNEKAAVDKLLRQRLGRKQMSARSASGQNHNAPPNSAKHLIHEITL